MRITEILSMDERVEVGGGRTVSATEWCCMESDRINRSRRHKSNRNQTRVVVSRTERVVFIKEIER